MLSCPPKCRPTGAAALTIEWPSRDAISAWSYTNGLRRYSKHCGWPPRRQVGVSMSAKHQSSTFTPCDAAVRRRSGARRVVVVPDFVCI